MPLEEVISMEFTTSEERGDANRETSRLKN